LYSLSYGAFLFFSYFNDETFIRESLGVCFSVLWFMIRHLMIRAPDFSDAGLYGLRVSMSNNCLLCSRQLALSCSYLIAVLERADFTHITSLDSTTMKRKYPARIIRS